jgi:electron transport complex protein RnfG
VIKYQILSHRETPGLGTGALKPEFIAQFKGKSVEDLVVVKLPTEKNIQALTGATITTRAVTNGVKRAAEEVIEYEKTRKK